jgi:hypothetical protein
LRFQALLLIDQWPGIDAGWQAEMSKQAASAELSLAKPGETVDEVELAAQIDTTPALAVSLHLFRRTPWPADVARIRVERAAVRKMKLGGAAVMAESAPASFPPERCAPR